MVRDYVTDLYEPAAVSGVAAPADGCARARSLEAFAQRISAAWSGVKIGGVDVDVSPSLENERRHARVDVGLGALAAADVAVQLLHGPVDSEGSFVGQPNVTEMDTSDLGTYQTEFEVGEAGPYGVTARVLPTHPDMVSAVELGLVAWSS
jgi:starch phosphorylase